MFERFQRNFDHYGLYVSEKTPVEEADFRRLQHEVDETYDKLPLENCTTGYDVLSERYCLVPPEGKVFRMTGKFYTELDGRYIEDYYSAHVASYEIAAESVKTHPLYDVLAEIDDDPEKLTSFILRGDIREEGSGYDFELPEWRIQQLKDTFTDYVPKYLPPRDFLGKLLYVQTGSNGRNERHVEVAVYGQPEMWSDAGLLPIALPIAESDEDEVYRADVRTIMHWSREIAVGTVGDMAIELCDEPKEFQQITHIEDRSRVNWNELWAPSGFKTTSHGYIDFAYQGFSQSAERLESARIYEMRRHRMSGMPFADDVARYFKIATPILEDYYTRQESLRQVVSPRPAYRYRDGIVREGLEETLDRYIGRMITPEQYGASLKAFDEKGRFKGDARNHYDVMKDDKERLSEVKKRLCAAGGTFFYLEKGSVII